MLIGAIRSKGRTFDNKHIENTLPTQPNTKTQNSQILSQDLRNRPKSSLKEHFLKEKAKASSKSASDTSKLDIGILEKKYQIISKVAKGGYGTVYYAKLKTNSPERFAIKVYFPNHRLYYALQEILYMKLLSSYDCFSKLKEVHMEKGSVIVVRN